MDKLLIEQEQNIIMFIRAYGEEFEKPSILSKLILYGSIFIVVIVLGGAVFALVSILKEDINFPFSFVKHEKEVIHGRGADSDSDGLPDTVEIMIGTNPNNADSNGNGVSDLKEYKEIISTIVINCSTQACPAGYICETTSGLCLKSTYIVVRCSSNADCSDNNITTTEECVNAGTSTAKCVYTYIGVECRSSADCNDFNASTLDTCNNAGTSNSYCSHTSQSIICNNDAECNDNNANTQDKCMYVGTASSYCVHDPISCNTDAECSDSNSYTYDSCQHAGTTSSECLHQTIKCLTNADCNDNNVYTSDVCSSPGVPSSSCLYTAIKCLSNTDCNDNLAVSQDVCHRDGTASSYCTNYCSDVNLANAISSNTTLTSKCSYNVTNAISFASSSLLLDCNGASIDGQSSSTLVLNITSSNTIIRNCIIGNFTQRAIYVYGGTTNNVIYNNTIRNGEYGLTITSPNVEIYNNIISSNQAVYVTALSAFPIPQNLVIKENTFNSNYGLRFFENGAANNTDLIANIFSTSTDIDFQSGTTHYYLRIINNSFSTIGDGSVLLTIPGVTLRYVTLEGNH